MAREEWDRTIGIPVVGLASAGPLVIRLFLLMVAGPFAE